MVYFFWQKITCVVDVRRMSSRNLCDAAKTLHGRETRAVRAKRQQALVNGSYSSVWARGLELCQVRVNYLCWGSVVLIIFPVLCQCAAQVLNHKVPEYPYSLPVTQVRMAEQPHP